MLSETENHYTSQIKIDYYSSITEINFHLPNEGCSEGLSLGCSDGTAEILGAKRTQSYWFMIDVQGCTYMKREE